MDEGAGSRGPIGPRGPRGLTGAKGDEGKTGPACKDVDRGKPGPSGPTHIDTKWRTTADIHKDLQKDDKTVLAVRSEAIYVGSPKEAEAKTSAVRILPPLSKTTEIDELRTTELRIDNAGKLCVVKHTPLKDSKVL